VTVINTNFVVPYSLFRCRPALSKAAGTDAEITYFIVNAIAQRQWHHHHHHILYDKLSPQLNSVSKLQLK